MNCSTEYVINIIIDCSIIKFSLASILIAIAMLIFIIHNLIKTRNNPNRVTLLLTANRYFALLLFFILIIITLEITLQGHTHIDFPFQNNRSCRICAVFYSNTLQAIYRLC